MIFIRQEITEFTYSNIVSTVPEYNPTTNYILGDMVRVGNYEYKSLYGTIELPNVGKDPLSNLGTSWFEYGSSNMYACLDLFAETKTVWTGDGILEFNRAQKDTLGIGNFTANKVTIEYRDNLGNVLDSDVYTYSNNALVIDEWTYGYADFQSMTNEVIFLPLRILGAKIRVIFEKNGNATDCGYLVAGRASYMGRTVDNVTFPDKRIGDRVVPVANFSTSIKSSFVMTKMNEAKKLINETMMFVIDNSDNSVFGNMVFLGKITKIDGNANNFEKNQITWQIEQTILI